MDGPASLELVTWPAGFEDFAGRQQRTLDDKFRVVLPAGPWRDAFSAGGKLTDWIDCLALWTPRSYQEYTAGLWARERAGQVAEGTHRDFREFTVDVVPDGQGRIILPADMRSEVGIGGKGDDVVLVGVGDRIEIWSPERRAAERAVRTPEMRRAALRAALLNPAP